MVSVGTKVGQVKEEKPVKPELEIENGFSKYTGAAIVAIIDLFLIIIGYLLLGICIIGLLACFFEDGKANEFIVFGYFFAWICVLGFAGILYKWDKFNDKLVSGIREKNLNLINEWICQNILVMLFLGGLYVYNLIYGSLEFYQNPEIYLIIYRGITFPFVYEFKNQIEKEIEEKIATGKIEIKIVK